MVCNVYDIRCESTFMMEEVCKPQDLKWGDSESHISHSDWRKCIFCRKVTSEALQSPAASARDRDRGSGYRTVVDNLIGFEGIGALEATLELSRLDEGGGIEATLRKNEAKWHCSCKLRYNRTKL